MAFESVQIQSTRNGVSGVVGFRQDLAQADVVGLSLTNTTGVTGARWNLIGRPRGSAAGGAGPEPVLLANALTASLTVDSDAGSFKTDGTYVVECILNPGSPSQTRKTVAIARSTGLTVPASGGGVYPLRKIGGFEALEDLSLPNRLQGFADQWNAWCEFARQISQGGAITTLAGAYGVGTSAGDQTIGLLDAKGGGVVVDGSAGGFTGATASLKVVSAAGGPVWFDRATGNLGWGTTAPVDEIHVKSASPGIRLERTGGKAIAIENVSDNVNFIDKAGPTILAQVIGTGGIRTDLGVGIGAAPSTSATLAMGVGSTASVSTSNTGRIRYNEVAQQFESSANGGAYTVLGSTGPSVGSVLTGAPSGTTNLGLLTSGVLQQTVASSIATPSALLMVVGQVPFGAANGTLTQDSNLFWDNTNKRLGIGTNAPIYPMEVSIGSSAAGRQGFRASTVSTATDAAAQFWATNGSKGIIVGVTGQSFVAVGALPNLGASTSYVTTSGAAGETLYLGSDNIITIQTGTTQAERIKIDASGNVSLSSLNAGGLVKAVTTTGQLLIATPGVDYLVGTATFTQGSVPFAGVSGALTQDNGNFFWDATNIRLGIGTNTPANIVDITRTQAGPVTVKVSNPGLTTTSDAVFNVANDGTAAAAFGITGKNWVEAGGSTVPNRGSNFSFLTTTTNGPNPTLYLGSHGVITMQTGATQAERLRIIPTGEVQLSSLTAGGMVHAAAGGQLGIGVDGTDFLAPPIGGLTTGSVLFASAAGKVTQDNANLFWDTSLTALGVGTHPANVNLPLHVRKDQDGVSNILIENRSGGTHAVSALFAVNSLPGPNQSFFSAGVTGAGYVATVVDPNLGPGTSFLFSGGNGTSTRGMYIGAEGFFSVQTGATRAEALRIDNAQHALLSSLNAGGMVKAAVTTGQLSIGVSGTDYLAPASALTTGSVLFAGAGGAVAQDNANFFWDDPNNQLGIGTNAPSQALHILKTGNFNTISLLQNLGTGALSQAQVSVHNGSGATALGMTASSFVAGGLEPNLGASTSYLRTSGASSTLYLGSFGIITLQTGATQAERLKVDVSGNVSISSLSAGGVVVADPITGKLGIGSSGGGGSGLGVVNTGGSTAFSLSTLASGVLEHVVTTSVSTPTSIAMVVGQIPFGSGTNGLLAQDANLVWDNTNKRLGLGTNAPSTILDIVVNTASVSSFARFINNSTSTSPTAAQFATANGAGHATRVGTMGVNSAAFSVTTPNLLAGMAFLVAVSATGMYIGSPNTISLQTGATQAERIKIDISGGVSLSSLAGGGVVHAANTTGLLSAGLIVTTDITDQNVTMGKLEPIGPSKILGNDGPATQSPFDISVIAPLRMVPGSGQLTFGTGFTQGSIVFQGASQINEDNAHFFWDDANNRLGIGTNAPATFVDIVINAAGLGPGLRVLNNSTSTSATTAELGSTNGTHAIHVGTMGLNSAAFSGSTPNLTAGMVFFLATSTTGMYIGSPNTISMQTGATQNERLKIDIAGNVTLSSLAAGGVVTAAGTTGQLGVTTFSPGRIPYGAGSGGGLAQDSTFVWDHGNQRLGVGVAIPGGDIHAFRSTGNTFTTIAAETGGLTSGYGSSFNALNDNGTVALFGATGSGYVDPGANPNLGASTAFVRNNNSNPLYIGSGQDITFQTGATAAERMRILSTGQVEVKHSLGVNCNPDTVNGTPSIFAAVATSAADKALFVLGGGPNIGGTGSFSYFEIADTATFVNSGANLVDLSKVHIAAPTWIANVASATMNGIAATLLIENAPNMAGGHWLFAGPGVFALAVKAGDVLFNNNLTVNGGITVGGNTLFAGTSTTIFGSFQTQSNIGFFSQAPAPKQTILGSKASGAAWASLLSALVAYGLVIDSTTP